MQNYHDHGAEYVKSDYLRVHILSNKWPSLRLFSLLYLIAILCLIYTREGEIDKRGCASRYVHWRIINRRGEIMLKEKRSIYSNFGDGIYSLSDIEKKLSNRRNDLCRHVNMKRTRKTRWEFTHSLMTKTNLSMYNRKHNFR